MDEDLSPLRVPALVAALQFGSPGEKKRALNVLSRIGKPALPAALPLLQELTHKDRFRSVIFLEIAHHVLHGLNQRGMIGPSAEVMKALESWDKEELVPWGAGKVLEALGKEK